MPSDLDTKFELLREVRPGVSLAVRTNDRAGQRYIARRLDQYHDKSAGLDLEQLLGSRTVAPLISLPLYHENIVSLVGHIRLDILNAHGPSEIEDYLVWDRCDAANLSTLFAQTAPAADTSAFYLPEGLCWHVLRALTKAVTYLHDGKRWIYDQRATEARQLRKWQSPDRNWRAILHRRIEPENVFFQHPRGGETYGTCKLGNLSQATVTSYMVGSINAPSSRDPVGAGDVLSQGVAVACKAGREPKADTLLKLEKDTASLKEAERLYTLREEMWSIASIVFTMMTGCKLTLCCKAGKRSHVSRCSEGSCAQLEAANNPVCNCVYGGCEHLSSEPCPHPRYTWKQCRSKKCGEAVVNVDDHLAGAKYSRWLRDQVEAMLAFDGKDPGEGLAAEARPFAESVEAAYWQWRRLTQEGDAHQDVEDEIVSLWVQDGTGREESVLEALLSQDTWETVY
ncbi:hypothetical protein S40288_07831 [Stachybotrys chartarum IBT 40288]|nr:hypothetical protein S40288_07831 [Stachybotrys chartarum IBT 40288]